ncbi:MAG: 50S ribosomal protein L11 methyltransferase [Anaerolineales bacterium]|nr:50S ribosomal protein L11 methyltransferase [Anaerolineales bacterium]MCB8951996.1 50S ribosomal protein L11 methyltransferase [Ardenticatenales bacterium]
MNWVEVSVVTDGEAAEAVSEVLRPFAHDESVVLEQLGDAASLDPYALEPAVTVKIYLPDDEQISTRQQRIKEALYFLGRLYPIPAPTFRVLQEQDWANAWKAHYEPFRIGRRLWIQPSWQPAQAVLPGDIVLTLDPGMAFGTGLHPTTQMCLQVLETLVCPGMSMLDVGTGSGILAVAGARLGAARVLGVDTDGLAVEAARANAALNGTTTQVRIAPGSLSSVPLSSWDLVLVNILAPVIESLLRQDHLLDYVAPEGFLILSGIIDAQLPGVTAAIVASGGEITQTHVIRDWVALVVQRATAPSY